MRSAQRLPHCTFHQPRQARHADNPAEAPPRRSLASSSTRGPQPAASGPSSGAELHKPARASPEQQRRGKRNQRHEQRGGEPAGGAAAAGTAARGRRASAARRGGQAARAGGGPEGQPQGALGARLPGPRRSRNVGVSHGVYAGPHVATLPRRVPAAAPAGPRSLLSLSPVHAFPAVNVCAAVHGRCNSEPWAARSAVRAAAFACTRSAPQPPLAPPRAAQTLPRRPARSFRPQKLESFEAEETMFSCNICYEVGGAKAVRGPGGIAPPLMCLLICGAHVRSRSPLACAAHPAFC